MTHRNGGGAGESTTDDGYIQAPPTIDYSRKVLFAAEGETAHEIDHEEQDVGRGSAPSSVLGILQPRAAAHVVRTTKTTRHIMHIATSLNQHPRS